MGQDIKYIITNQNVEIPKQVVHFREGNGIVIPIDLDDFDFEFIIENASAFKTVNDFLDFMEEDKEDYFILEKSAIEVIEIIKSLNINSFVFCGFSGWAIPWIVFKDGLIVEKDGNIDTMNPNSIIGLDVSMYTITNKEDFYRSYDNAHAKYREFNPEIKEYKRWIDEELDDYE